MNSISDRVKTGTIGELLVQLRLLQYGVQAAAPIKDSGNDLIAVNGREFRAVSVRTTTRDRFDKPEPQRLYDVLAVVHLSGHDQEISLDESRIFLIPYAAVAAAPDRCDRLAEFSISVEHVARLFGPPCA